MLSSIRNRLTLVILVSMIVMMSLFAWVVVSDQRHEIKEDAYRELVTTGSLAQGMLNRMMRYGRYELVSEMLAELSVNSHIEHIFITNNKCKLIYATNGFDLGRCVEDILAAGSSAIVGKVAHSGVSEFVYIDSANKYIAYVPLIASHGDILSNERYVLVIEYALSREWLGVTKSRMHELVLVILLQALISGLLWLYLNKRLTLPVLRLAESVDAMARGERFSPAYSDASDEIGVLSRALESMSIQRADYETRLQRLSMAVEQSWDSVIVTNLSAEIEYVNAAFIRNTGYEKEEVIGKNPRVLQSGITSQETYSEMWHALQEGKVWQGELVNKRKDGEEYIEWATISPVRNEHGEVTHYLGIKQNITERRRLEEDRIRAERVVDKFFNQPMSLNMIASLDGVIRRVNPAWEQILGYKSKDMEGRPFLDFVHPDDRDNTAIEHDNVVAGQPARRFESRYRDKAGRYHTFIGTSVLSEEDGLIYTVANDISDRKEAEDKLRDVAEVFRSSGEGVVITDVDCAIKDVNAAFVEITGYAKESVIGKNPRFLQSGRHDRSFYQSMWRTLEDAGHWHGEIWNRRRNGEIYPELLTVSQVTDDQGATTGYVGVFTDITNMKESERKLSFLAHHDPLTELPNRLLLDARLSHSISHALRNKQKLAVMFIDIDRFKYINDSMGHSAGDKVLGILAQRLTASVRSGDTVARIGGDEFVVLLENVSDADDVASIAEKLMAGINTPIMLTDNEIRMTASIGISFYPEDGENNLQLMRNADAAMYRAKDLGRDTYQFYTEELTNIAFEHMFIENALRGAIERDELRLVYQPQVDLHDQGYVGMEALLRWHHPDQGVISPARFIPIAEHSGIIREIGHWVMMHACAQGKEWLERGIEFGHISVNVAGPQLQQSDCVAMFSKVLEDTGLPPEYLELEVTEGFVMRNAEEAIEKLNALRGMGISIAIDDFGTGYSSLSYLKKLPINKLKIDQGFVRDILDDANDLVIAQSVIALGKAMGMQVIAEGVEQQAQAELLKKKGCDHAQGYFFGRPVPPEELWFNKSASTGIVNT